MSNFERGKLQILEEEIVDTIRYGALFQMPLTATQLWRCLVGKAANGVWRLSDVRRSLADLVQHGELETQDGYWFLPGKAEWVRERLTRQALAQQKWKIMRPIARWLAVAPFVRALS